MSGCGRKNSWRKVSLLIQSKRKHTLDARAAQVLHQSSARCTYGEAIAAMAWPDGANGWAWLTISRPTASFHISTTICMI
jgi:hypothetical protein